MPMYLSPSPWAKQPIPVLDGLAVSKSWPFHGFDQACNTTLFFHSPMYSAPAKPLQHVCLSAGSGIKPEAPSGQVCFPTPSRVFPNHCLGVTCMCFGQVYQSQVSCHTRSIQVSPLPIVHGTRLEDMSLASTPECSSFCTATGSWTAQSRQASQRSEQVKTWFLRLSDYQSCVRCITGYISFTVLRSTSIHFLAPRTMYAQTRGSSINQASLSHRHKRATSKMLEVLQLSSLRSQHGCGSFGMLKDGMSFCSDLSQEVVRCQRLARAVIRLG